MSLSLGEMASIVSNRMYAFGETYAHAKAWVLANLSTSSTADGTSLDAIQTPITTAGGQAPASRGANWYTPASLFSDLPSSSKNTTPLPGGLDIAGQEGNV